MTLDIVQCVAEFIIRLFVVTELTNLTSQVSD